jgi:hypothetical protein
VILNNKPALVSEICQKNGIQILNYLDDLAGCEEEHYCNFPMRE